VQVKTGLLVEEDSKMVGKMLRSQVSGLVREREERRKNQILSEFSSTQNLDPQVHSLTSTDPHFPEHLHGQPLLLTVLVPNSSKMKQCY